MTDSLAQSPPTADPPSTVAVLPFEASGAPDTEYLARGMTEAVIAMLSRAPGLRVVASNSVRPFTRLSRGLKALLSPAYKLGARYLVLGALGQQEDGLRLTVELLEPRPLLGRPLEFSRSGAIIEPTVEPIWKETFEGDGVPFNQLCRQVAGSLARALGTGLEAGAGGWTLPDDLDPRALDAWLRARDACRRDSEGEALAIVEAALQNLGESEPLLVLAGDLRLEGSGSDSGDPADRTARAAEYAERALALDPASSPAWYLLGRVHDRLRRPVEATVAFHRAVRLDFACPDALASLAVSLAAAGLDEQALPVARALLALDPSHWRSHFAAAMVHWLAGRFGLAATEMRRSGVYRVFEIALVYAGEVDLARRRLDGRGWDTMELRPFLEERLKYRWAPRSAHERVTGFALNALLFDRESALAQLTPEALAGAEDEGYAWWLADGYAALGEREEALRWLAIAAAGGLPPDFIARHDPYLAPLRDDARFGAIVETARARQEAVREAIAREPPLRLPA